MRFGDVVVVAILVEEGGGVFIRTGLISVMNLENNVSWRGIVVFESGEGSCVSI